MLCESHIDKIQLFDVRVVVLFDAQISFNLWCKCVSLSAIIEPLLCHKLKGK